MRRRVAGGLARRATLAAPWHRALSGTGAPPAPRLVDRSMPKNARAMRPRRYKRYPRFCQETRDESPHQSHLRRPRHNRRSRRPRGPGRRQPIPDAGRRRHGRQGRARCRQDRHKPSEARQMARLRAGLHARRPLVCMRQRRRRQGPTRRPAERRVESGPARADRRRGRQQGRGRDREPRVGLRGVRGPRVPGRHAALGPGGQLPNRNPRLAARQGPDPARQARQTTHLLHAPAKPWGQGEFPRS